MKHADEGNGTHSGMTLDGERPEGRFERGGLLDLNQSVELLNTSRPTFYRWLRSGRIKGMKVGRQWRFYREDLERFLKGQEPRIDLPADISPFVNELRDQLASTGVTPPSPDGRSPIEEAVRLSITLAIAIRASGIHVCTQMASDFTERAPVIRYRVDGALRTMAKLDPRLMSPFIEQWKRMAACDVHEHSKAQDGRIVMRLSELDTGKPQRQIDVRVCFLPTALGESLTARILDSTALAPGMLRTHFAPKDQERILRALRVPYGLLVVTGPPACGEATTLYSCLREINTEERKVMTIEDPVQLLLPGVVQTAVNPQAGVTFATGIQSILRSDPDVVLIGHIPDPQTLALAQQAALTGLLVLTGLHADSAASALKRMADMGSDPFAVADATRLVTAQRLVRKLCPHCSVEATPAADELGAAAEVASAGGVRLDALPKRFRKAVGCAQCADTGYQGRTLVAETLEITPEIEKAIRRSATPEELTSIAVCQGMTTMAADGIGRAAMGQTTLYEVMRVLS